MNQVKNNNIRVGIFLAIGSFVMLLSIILLSGDRGLFKRHVILYAAMDQVQGLSKGSVISLSGVVIGNILDIDFIPEKKSLVVKLKIEEEYLPLITEGSKADVRTQGALGDKYVYINPGDPNGKPLKANDYIDTVKSADILGIISEKGGEATKIFDIITEVYRLTKIINAEGRSEKMMTNFVEASQNLRAVSEDARKMMAELRSQNPTKLKESVEHLNSVLAKIDRGEGTLGALVNDSSLHDRLKAVLGTDSHKTSIQSLIRTSIKEK